MKNIYDHTFSDYSASKYILQSFSHSISGTQRYSADCLLSSCCLSHITDQADSHCDVAQYLLYHAASFSLTALTWSLTDV